jgi:chemotaxis protein methyltransferase CheR
MKPEHIRFFAKYIEDELGIVYDELNHFQLTSRLQEIMKFYSFSSLEQMYLKAKEGISGGFKQMLLDVATNNETFFFRDPKVFQNLLNSAIPNLVAELRPNETLRIWSAACSTGQEPYSMAILLAELRARMSLPKVEIIATDISQRILERARKGCFSQLEVQRGLPTPLLIKYFTKNENDLWSLKPEIKLAVTFREKNLKKSFDDLGLFHLILCRNVLIYQNMKNKVDIVNRITKQLNPGGYLILGAAESLFGISNEFTQLVQEGVILHKTKSGVAA